MIPGKPYAGFDRHNGEIAGFHLDGYTYYSWHVAFYYICSLLSRILDFRLAPPVVGRVLNLSQLAPVTSEKLMKTYFKDGMMCC